MLVRPFYSVHASAEAASHDLNDPCLLLRRHLVVTGQTKSAFEDIRAHIFRPLSSGHKGMIPVDGLQVHGLPDGPSAPPYP